MNKLILILLVTILCNSDFNATLKPPKASTLIAHAGGGIDGHAYLNTADAFQMKYGEGYRLFEYDLIMTDDNRVVACHNWDDYNAITKTEGIPSLEMFENESLYNYDTTSLSDIIDLMVENRDVILITDVKHDHEIEAYKAIIEEFKDTAPELLERVIPEVYSIQMYYDLDKIHSFNDYILTLYKMKNGDIDHHAIIELTKTSNINYVAYYYAPSTTQLLEDLIYNGVIIMVYTVNDLSEYWHLMNMGVAYVFSDTLQPIEERRG